MDQPGADSERLQALRLGLQQIAIEQRRMEAARPLQEMQGTVQKIQMQ